MTTFPPIDHELFERGLRQFAGTETGELFEVAEWCANQLGVASEQFYVQEAFDWFMGQAGDRLEDIAIYEVPLVYTEYDTELCGDIAFFLLPSGAFGCWRFDSAGDTIPFVIDEFDVLTLPFHLRKAFMTAEGVQFDGAKCLSHVRLRAFEFENGETYPIDDPIFWCQVYNVEDMAREVEEAKRHID